MTNYNSQRIGTRTSLISAAFTLCLKRGDKLINIDQLKTRNFAPTRELCLSAICELVKDGVVDTVSNDLLGQPFVFKSFLFHEKNRDNFVVQQTRNVIENRDDPSQLAELQTLQQEIIAAECIEYIKFYTERQFYELVEVENYNAKLQLLCLELQPAKINALLWRSIKKNIGRSHSNKLHLYDVIDEAFDRFIQLKRRKEDWEGYERPKMLKMSAIANVTMFCIEHYPPETRLRSEF